MNKYNKNYLIYAISIALGGQAGLALADTAVVNVDMSTQHYIGGTSELDRTKFFNIHSSANEPGLADIDLLYINEELNADFGRMFWGPMAVSKTSDYPSTSEAMTKGQSAIDASLTSTKYPYISNRTIITEHPAAVLAPGNDPVDGARWAADYFEYYFNDTKRPLFYEPMNEPFVHASDFVEGWDPVKNQQVQLEMANWFKEIGKEFDRRGLNTSVIGYSSAWPSFELNDFAHWEESQKMFMDVAGDYMDGFSFHLYDGINVTGQDNFRSGSNAEAIIDLIEAYSFQKWGKVKPHAITEYGGIVKGYPIEYSGEKSAQELRTYNHILFSLLDREDRILTSVPFITGVAKWFYEANDNNPYSATVLRPDPSKIVSGKVNGFLPTEKAKFYQLWSEVKGHRIEVTSDDTDLSAQAFVYGNKLYLALNNYEDETKDVSLDFMQSSQIANSVIIKRLNVPQHQAATFSQETLEVSPTRLTLADHETVVLEYNFPNTITHNKQKQEKTYYSDVVIQPILADSTINAQFSNVELTQKYLSFSDVVTEYFPYDENYVPYEFTVDQQAYQDLVNQFKTVAMNNEDEVEEEDDENEWISPRAFKRFLKETLQDKTQLKDFVAQYRFEFRTTKKLAKFETAFSKILKKHGAEWRQSKKFEKLVQRAVNNDYLKAALHTYYQTNGYNDGNGYANLRMSISRKHDKSKQPELTFNGHKIAVPNDWKGYDQAERSDFFGTIDIPVPVKFIKENNDVAMTFPDSQGAVSSLILEAEVENPLTMVPVESIAFDHENIIMNKDKPRRLTVNFMPYNATNKNLVWTSTNVNVASINKNGIITPVAPGSSTIQAVSESGEFVATAYIEVQDQLSVRNTVAMVNPPSDMESTNELSIDIAYSSDIDRDVSLELYSPQNQWLGRVKQTVSAGEGEVTLVLNLANMLSAGEGYKLISSLQAVDGDWRTSVDGHTINTLNVISPVIENDNTLLSGLNYDFETGDLTDWLVQGTGEAYVVDAEQGTATIATGNYGLFVDTTAGPVNVVLSKERVNAQFMKTGKQLKLSFDVKRVRGSAGGVGGLRYLAGLDASNAWVWTGGQWWWVGKPVGEWQHIEVMIDGQDWQDLQTYLYISFATTGEQFYLDNVMLEDVTPDDNLLANANADFELPTLGTGIYGRVDAGQENLAYFDIRSEAATSGQSGLYVDSTAGDLRLQISSDAIDHNNIDVTKSYALTYDIEVISGDARLFYNPMSGNQWTPSPGWGSFYTAADGVVNVSIPVTAAELVPGGNFHFNLHMNAGVVAHIDNIRLAPIN